MNPHIYKNKTKKLLINEKLKLLLDVINFVKIHKFEEPIMILYIYFMI